MIYSYLKLCGTITLFVGLNGLVLSKAFWINISKKSASKDAESQRLLKNKRIYQGIMLDISGIGIIITVISFLG